MLINGDVDDLNISTGNLVNNITSIISSVDWSSTRFDRSEATLREGRLCLLPYLISRPEQLLPTPDSDLIISSLGPLISLIKEHLKNYKIVRGELVNLLPGKHLTEHIDIYWFHKESRRIHVPLLTNKNCKLTFEGREHHLEVGKVYEINNRIMHSGFNRGNSDRIHLILDMMPVSVFQQAVENKQNFLEIVK